MVTIGLEKFKIEGEEMVAHRSLIGYNPYRSFEAPKNIEIDNIKFNFSHFEARPVWGIEFIYVSEDFICPVRFVSKSF